MDPNDLYEPPRKASAAIDPQSDSFRDQLVAYRRMSRAKVNNLAESYNNLNTEDALIPGHSVLPDIDLSSVKLGLTLHLTKGIVVSDDAPPVSSISISNISLKHLPSGYKKPELHFCLTSIKIMQTLPLKRFISDFNPLHNYDTVVPIPAGPKANPAPNMPENPDLKTAYSRKKSITSSTDNILKNNHMDKLQSNFDGNFLNLNDYDIAYKSSVAQNDIVIFEDLITMKWLEVRKSKEGTAANDTAHRHDGARSNFNGITRKTSGFNLTSLFRDDSTDAHKSVDSDLESIDLLVIELHECTTNELLVGRFYIDLTRLAVNVNITEKFSINKINHNFLKGDKPKTFALKRRHSSNKYAQDDKLHNVATASEIYAHTITAAASARKSTDQIVVPHKISPNTHISRYASFDAHTAALQKNKAPAVIEFVSTNEEKEDATIIKLQNILPTGISTTQVLKDDKYVKINHAKHADKPLYESQTDLEPSQILKILHDSTEIGQLLAKNGIQPKEANDASKNSQEHPAAPNDHVEIPIDATTIKTKSSGQSWRYWFGKKPSSQYEKLGSSRDKSLWSSLSKKWTVSKCNFCKLYSLILVVLLVFLFILLPYMLWRIPHTAAFYTNKSDKLAIHAMSMTQNINVAQLLNNPIIGARVLNMKLYNDLYSGMSSAHASTDQLVLKLLVSRYLKVNYNNAFHSHEHSGVLVSHAYALRGLAELPKFSNLESGPKFENFAYYLVGQSKTTDIASYELVAAPATASVSDNFQKTFAETFLDKKTYTFESYEQARSPLHNNIEYRNSIEKNYGIYCYMLNCQGSACYSRTYLFNENCNIWSTSCNMFKERIIVKELSFDAVIKELNAYAQINTQFNNKPGNTSQKVLQVTKKPTNIQTEMELFYSPVYTSLGQKQSITCTKSFNDLGAQKNKLVVGGLTLDMDAFRTFYAFATLNHLHEQPEFKNLFGTNMSIVGEHKDPSVQTADLQYHDNAFDDGYSVLLQLTDLKVIGSSLLLETESGTAKLPKRVLHVAEIVKQKYADVHAQQSPIETEIGDLVVISNFVDFHNLQAIQVFVKALKTKQLVQNAVLLETIIIWCIMAALTVAVSFCLYFFVFKKLQNAIRALVNYANMRFTTPITDKDCNSWITEVNKINHAALRLRTTLRSFEKYVPPQIVKNLTEKHLEASLGGGPRNICVMFIDIANFTELSEKWTLDQLIEMLADFLQTMSRIIEDSSGLVDKFIGDCIMAIWNVPEPTNNYIELACKAAFVCGQAALQLQDRWKLNDKDKFQVRIGLHCGDAVVGNIGSFERMAYTAIGDTVNLASRIESLNKNYNTQLIITDSVFQHVSHLFICRPLDVVTVKGKSKLTVLYELICPMSSASRITLASRDAFEAAVIYFRYSDFLNAREWFQRCLVYNPDDGAVKEYLKKCEHFLLNKPLTTWSSVNNLSEK